MHIVRHPYVAFERTGRSFHRGLKEAGKDDNVVIYTRKQQAEFDALKTAVEKPSRRGRASRRAPYAVLPMVASGAAI